MECGDVFFLFLFSFFQFFFRSRQMVLGMLEMLGTMQYLPAGHTYLPVSEKETPPYTMDFFNQMGKT